MLRERLLLCLLIGCAVVFAKDYEKIFLSVPDAARAKETLRTYTSSPHVAGTEEGYETAKYTLEEFQKHLPEAEIQSFSVLLTYPLERVVEIVAPEDKKYVAKMEEPPVEGDPTSYLNTTIPTFNGYSPSGNVTAEVVYVNYGSLQDYEVLEQSGVNVAGKVVIARYGFVFRGVKAMIAEMKGAVGVLIYSDPKDDGFGRGETYPDGPWRSEDSVQRGSVQYLSICPGQPDTLRCFGKEFNGSYEGLLPQIPVQPLSWGDAQHILRALGGDPADESFQGGLNFTYKYGPGPATVHLYTRMNFTNVPIHNVVGKIPGSVEPDRAIIIGNHRDAWVFGAVDPSSGSTSLLEVVRGFGQLLKEGWRPRRTIIFCSWDAEEYGLVGSVEYAANDSKIPVETVAYLNVDIGVSGKNFLASATPSLSEIIRQVAKDIIDPATNKSLSEIWNQKTGRLGSGSDYTAFLDHLGIPSVDLRFVGDYGVYHSNYDSYHWMDLFGAPTYEYYVTMSQFWGLLTLRLADSAVLPLNYVEYAEQLEIYLKEVESMSEGNPHSLPFDSIRSSIEKLKAKAEGIREEGEKLLKSNPNDKQLRALNDKLTHAERQFVHEEGLPGRRYYRHMVQAPGLFQGYASDVFPGVAQAIRDEDWEGAKEFGKIISDCISGVSTYLEKGDSSPDDEGGLGAGWIILIVIICLGVVITAAAGIYVYYRRSRTQYTEL